MTKRKNMLLDTSHFKGEDFYSFDETLLKIIHDGLIEWEYQSSNENEEMHHDIKRINDDIEKYLKVMYGSPSEVLDLLLHDIFSTLEGIFKALWY